MNMRTPSTSLHGKTILITGATQGLGRHVALDLAGRGATLLLHGRDPGRLDETAAAVRAVAPDVTVRTFLADLSDLDQVRVMTARVLDTEPRLEVLVNNAAIGFGTDHTRREVSAQAHELRFAVNHLAPHLLTRELLPLLTASTPARVVNVASIGQAPIDFDDVMLEHDYTGVDAYCRSKLAMIMSTFDLAAELADSKVTVNAVHPAHLMDTPGVRESGLTPEIGIDEGVRPTVRLITDPALQTVTGRYFDQFTDSPAHGQAYDTTARARLAALTRDLLA
ncbi:SDR family NAD(P)-dependent oxidoreductase [Streptomyces triticiradicis]|uniref:SDR family NAD(P)-dependent oxidoreductase n=1 Tax=Streptomyces triticiradicis TaxID=2651189 RepID=A0A7J5D363_9ACTN|nr:SDR family NAD(P)-dependent oxidoreductase [Streptomyces triticiradicis]KAB1977774.1 SDR family NAD(P)-dependent oxidoreductase [Streptomyces triticiradicis]